MLEIGRLTRVVTAAMCATALVAACSSGGDAAPAPDGGGLITVTTMRGALLQASDIGPTWAEATESAAPQTLPPICAGPATAPPLPPGAQTVTRPLADEGQTGAQSLQQVALVYDDATGAAAGLAALQAVADNCPASVSRPATVTGERSEPAYTETARTTELAEGGWTGFVVLRKKQYEVAHPGTADTAVAVLSRQNVVLVDVYAVYRLGTPSAASQFDSDWKKLVGTVLNRVG